LIYHALEKRYGQFRTKIALFLIEIVKNGLAKKTLAAQGTNIFWNILLACVGEGWNKNV
jgi:hypothetical protein